MTYRCAGWVASLRDCDSLGDGTPRRQRPTRRGRYCEQVSAGRHEDSGADSLRRMIGQRRKSEKSEDTLRQDSQPEKHFAGSIHLVMTSIDKFADKRHYVRLKTRRFASDESAPPPGWRRVRYARKWFPSWAIGGIASLGRAARAHSRVLARGEPPVTVAADQNVRFRSDVFTPSSRSRATFF